LAKHLLDTPEPEALIGIENRGRVPLRIRDCEQAGADGCAGGTVPPEVTHKAIVDIGPNPVVCDIPGTVSIDKPGVMKARSILLKSQ